MRLRRLEVWHFGGIAEAEVQFGPGLNLLWGPNELGKSTLLKSIRAVLLLPDSSSAHREFVDWHSGESPRVRLEFETAPHEIWRVDKRFGKNASSVLEHSKDGVSYSREARGREVDGRLRELLEWGLASPGGAVRQRGFPSSFLTTALLGEQGDVDEVLGKGLDDDPDESGRKRITMALQALAEDPLFRRVLDRTRGKVREAYTSTGRKSTRKDSPWKQLQERRQLAERRREDVRGMVESSTGARKRIEEQQAIVDVSRQKLAQAEGVLEQIETAWKQGAARRLVEERTAEARAEVARVEGLLAAAAATEQRLGAARDAQQALDAGFAAAELALAQATSTQAEVRETLRELESGDAERTRKLREQELEKTELGLSNRRQHVQARIEQAERVGELEQKASVLVEEIASREAETSIGQQEVAARKAEVETAARACLARAWVDAQADVAQATASARDVADLHTRATELRAESTALEKTTAACGLPGLEELRALRQLERDLRVAEEKLAVGLSVVLEPKRSVQVAVSTDGDRSELELTKAAQLSADAEITLDLPDVVVQIRGGSESIRSAARALRQEWTAQSQPHFERTGAASLDQLEGRIEEARQALDRARALTAEAATLEARAAGAGDVEAALKRATEQLERKQDKVRQALPKGGTLEDARGWQAADSAGADVETAEAELAEKRAAIVEVERRLDHARGLVESQQNELAADRREVEAAADGLDGPWGDVLEEAQRELAEVVKQLSATGTALSELRKGAKGQVSEATEALAQADAAHRAATKRLREADAERGKGRQRTSRLEGELAQQQSAADREDVDPLREVLRRCEEELAALPRPQQEITDEQRTEAQAMVQQEQASLRAEHDELQRFEGGLEQVGGQYVEEQLEQAEEAVQAVAESEREKELDYGAWQLLLETLKTAEADAAVHLGKALVEPVAARMNELTGGRYGSPAIGPKLGTDAIMFAGENRPLDSLSVGAREQLATLFRLTIAEKLGTAVVLDDQLVQSDAERMGFFGQLMRECGREFQILVLTCQPDAYDFRPEDGVTVTELENHIVRTGRPVDKRRSLQQADD